MTSPLRLKHVARVIAGQSPPSDAVADLADGLPFLQGNAEFGATSPSARYESDNAPKRCTQGDVLLSVRAPVGALNIADRDYGIGRGLCAIRAVAVVPRFLWWWAHTQVVTLNSVATGSTYTAVSADDVGNLPVPNVPLDEQRRIADFLDAETARLDQVASARREQVRLITERSQAVLDEAVDGLPQLRLARLLRVLQDGTHQPPSRVSSGIPLLTARNVSSGSLRLTDADTMVSEEDALTLERALRPAPGDVLLSVKGTIGAVARVPLEFPRAVLDRNVALLRPIPTNLRSEWLELALRSRCVQEQFTVSINAAAQPGLPLGTIAATQLPTPPVSQQVEISVRIARQRQAMDAAVAAIERSVGLLTERRRALITAAVTGQLDVTTARGGHK